MVTNRSALVATPTGRWYSAWLFLAGMIVCMLMSLWTIFWISTELVRGFDLRWYHHLLSLGLQIFCLFLVVQYLKVLWSFFKTAPHRSPITEGEAIFNVLKTTRFNKPNGWTLTIRTGYKWFDENFGDKIMSEKSTVLAHRLYVEDRVTMPVGPPFHVKILVLVQAGETDEQQLELLSFKGGVEAALKTLENLIETVANNVLTNAVNALHATGTPVTTDTYYSVIGRKEELSETFRKALATKCNEARIGFDIRLETEFVEIDLSDELNKAREEIARVRLDIETSAGLTPEEIENAQAIEAIRAGRVATTRDIDRSRITVTGDEKEKVKGAKGGRSATDAAKSAAIAGEVLQAHRGHGGAHHHQSDQIHHIQDSDDVSDGDHSNDVDDGVGGY